MAEGTTEDGVTQRPLSDVVESVIKEFARVDRRTLQRLREESELSAGDRPTYRVADVSVQISGRAVGGDENVCLADEQFDLSVSFSIRQTFGGDLLA